MVPLVWLAAAGRGPVEHGWLERLLFGSVMPVQWATAAVDRGSRHLLRRYVLLVDVERRNGQLAGENAELRARLAAGEEQAQENGRLRQLVGLQQRARPLRMVAAEIIAVSPSPLFRSVRIDRGRRHGLQPGAAVLTHDGVVGRVAALGDFFADVMMLVDGGCSVDVVVQRTRARARVRGKGDDGHMELATQYLARAADVEPGDALVTSGLGGTFPKGLPVGSVVAIRRPAFGLYQEADVDPSVDFRRLEAVLVVAGPPGAVDLVVPASGDQAATSSLACEGD